MSLLDQDMFRQWTSFLADAPIALIATDSAGTVTHWSPYAEALYGWAAQDALGRNIGDLTVGPETQDEADAIMATLRDGGHWQGEFVARRADGTPIDVHVLDVPIVVDGAIVGVCGMSVDVSAHRSSLREETAASRRALDAVESAREAERARIGAEIHDEIGQHVTALRTELLTLRDRIPLEPPDAESLQRALRSADVILTSVRSLSLELRPPLLHDGRLDEALEVLVTQFRRRTGIAATLHVDERVATLTLDDRVELYRIVQEALTNVERHAKAGRVDIDLVLGHAGGFVLQVRDDGIGLNGTKPSGRSSGLSIMRERVRRLDGVLHVRSAAGTVIEVRRTGRRATG